MQVIYLVDSLCSVDTVSNVEPSVFLGVRVDLNKYVGSNLTVLRRSQVDKVTQNQRLFLLDTNKATIGMNNLAKPQCYC